MNMRFHNVVRLVWLAAFAAPMISGAAVSLLDVSPVGVSHVVATPLTWDGSGQRPSREDGQNPIPIYYPTNVTPRSPVFTAARQLAGYLGRMAGGVTFTAAPMPAVAPGRAILIGSSDPAGGGAGAALAVGLGDDDFRIKVEGQRIHIVGGAEQGTAYGVFAFLEEDLGWRWWARDAEGIFTNRPTLSVPEGDRTVRAPFLIHDLRNEEAQAGENAFTLKARTDSALKYTGSHTLKNLLKPYYAQHPEILPMNSKGVRGFNKLHFCYMASNIVDYLTEALGKEVEARHGDVAHTIYFAGMGDWYGGMCECPACKAVYEEEAWTDPDGARKPGYTATLLRMVNGAAARLAAKYPGIKVGTFAYMSLEAPPARTKPADNVIVRVPRLRHCTVHAVGACGGNRGFERNLERWCAIAPGRVYVWEYGASFVNFLVPFPCLYSMAGNLKTYRKMGVRGVEIQGNYVSTGGDLAVLKNYVWRRLFWQPELEPAALVKEFCQGYYGPAADNMLAYVDALEQSVNVETNRICADEFDKRFPYLLPAVKTQLAARRDAALAAAGTNEPWLQRVREATLGLEALALWKDGPLVEADGKLARQDLGGYTFDRAVALLKAARGGSVTEWSGGKAAGMGFLTMHGGPLVSFTNGPAVFKIAPVLNGRIRQITYNGQPLLAAPPPNDPMAGGSWASLGTRCMLLEGEPTPTHARMAGEGGLSLWSRSAYQRVWLTADLAADGALCITGTVRCAIPDRTRQSDKASTTVQTEYLMPTNSADLRVEYLTKAGAWTPTDPAATNLFEAIAGWRLVLKQCVVTDLYAFPENNKGRLVLDNKKQTLTTVVSTSAVDAPLQGEAVFFTRRLRVQPLTNSASLAAALKQLQQ